MTTAAEATGAPMDVIIAGKTYRMEPLAGTDFAEIDNWIRSWTLQLALPVAQNLPTAQATMILDSAMRVATESSMATEHGQAVLKSPHGLARFIYQAVKKNHPAVNYQELWDALRDPDNMQAAAMCFQMLHGGSQKKTEVESGPAPSTGDHSTDG
jgi:hypothetical protein